MPLPTNNARISLFSFSPGFSGAIVLTLVMVILQALPESWRELLQYQRLAVADGQWWRLITAGFVHLGWRHLLLNACALLIMGWLFGEERSAPAWALDLLICTLVCHLGLYLFNPEVFWVVGLSGSLHGLFIIGAVSWIAAGIDLGKWLLTGVGIKLLWEQVYGEMPLSAEVVGGAVITDAHLWGAAGGIIAVLGRYLWRLLRTRL